MIAKHDLLLDREIKLGSRAILTIDDPQRIVRLPSDLLWTQEMIAPGLLAKINGQLQIR
jgi:hypothetical protein